METENTNVTPENQEEESKTETENINAAAENQEEEEYIECPNNIQESYCPECGLSNSTMKNPSEETMADSKNLLKILDNKKFIVSITALAVALVFVVIFLACHYNTRINELEKNYTVLEKSYSDLKTEYTDYKTKTQATPTPTPTPTPAPTPVPTPTPTKPPQQSVQQSSKAQSNKNEVLCGVPCIFSDYKVTYNSFSFSSDYEGNAVIIENLTFENLSSEARPFFTTASVTMYQDGVELENAYFVDGYDAGLSQRKVQQGGKLDVQEAHILRNKTSPITIEISDWISFNGVKYKGIIPLS